MFVFAAILVLFFTSIMLLFIRYLGPRPVHYWLIVVIAIWIGWGLILFRSFQTPFTSYQIVQQIIEIGYVVPAWGTDSIAWFFVTILSSLIFSVAISEIGRGLPEDWRDWIGFLALSGFGLIVMLSGNLVALLYAWTALDVGEYLIIGNRIPPDRIRDQFTRFFLIRVLGSMMLLSAIVFDLSGGSFWDTNNHSLTKILLLIGTGLRLGVLPFQISHKESVIFNSGIGWLVKLNLAASCILAIVRMAQITSIGVSENILLGLVSIAALYGSTYWTITRDYKTDMRYWILGVSAQAGVAAIAGLQLASLVWGGILLIEGGVIYLSASREKLNRWIQVFAGVLLVTLPYAVPSPFQRSNQSHLAHAVLLLSHGILVAGYFRRIFRERTELQNELQGMKAIYFIGLIILPLTQVYVSWLIWPENVRVSLTGWWQIPVVVGISLAISIIQKTGFRSPGPLNRTLKNLFSFNWMSNSFTRIYESLGTFVNSISIILEGEAGILWAMLLLVFLVTIVLQGIVGG